MTLICSIWQNEGTSRKKSLKEVINFSLVKNLKGDKQKTVDLFSKIQEIVKESEIAKKELQKSGIEIRKQLIKKYYQKK